MKKQLALLSLLSLFIVQAVNAQDSSLTYVTGEGLYLKLGKAGSSQFNLINTVQTGFQYNYIDDGSAINRSNRLSLNLVRTSFTASLLKGKVSMGIATDYTGTSPILEGWVGFSLINKNSKLYFGQRQTHTNNRLAMADERFAQNVGQTIQGKSNDGIVYGGLMQNFVGATREGGLFLETRFALNNRWVIYPSASITTGEGQNFFTTQENTGFKYGGRIDVLPMGDFIKNNAFIAEDIYREPKPKLAIGIAASYNVKSSSPIGSENGIISGIYDKNGEVDFANYGKLATDFIFKSNGFSLVGEYINGTIHGKELYTDAAGSNKFTEQTANAFYNLGSAYNVQTAYVTKGGWSVGGRYAHIEPEFKEVTSLVRDQDWYTFTLNKYLKNNAIKAGLNVTYLSDNFITNKAKQWIGNLALQISL